METIELLHVRSKEFFVNLKPSDIPPVNHRERAQFIAWEEQKCREGVWINGIYFPPTLYWHLNHIKIMVDVKDNHGNIVPLPRNPVLRDNDWIKHHAYYDAWQQDKKEVLMILGSRQIGKSVTESSIILHTLTIFQNSQAMLMGGSKEDIGVITKYIQTMHHHGTDFMMIPLIDKDWRKDQIRFGEKLVDNTNNIWSTLHIRNTDMGVNTEITAGVTVNAFIADEVGKYPYSKAYEASKPAFVSRYGWRCVPIKTGTGGDFEKGRDAESAFLHPTSNNVRSYIQPDGRRTGLFISGHYRQDAKYETTLADYLRSGMVIPDHVPSPQLLHTGVQTDEQRETRSELDDIEMWVTDFAKAEEIINEEEEDLLKANDMAKVLKHRMYYPLKYQDIFLTIDDNPFGRFVDDMRKHQQQVTENNKSILVTPVRNTDGIVELKPSPKQAIQHFPTQSWENLDAPITLYDKPKHQDAYYLHVAGLDPYNTSQTVTSASLGALYLMRRRYIDLADSYQNTMVASYVARPEKMNTFLENVEMLLEAYGATMLHEVSNDLVLSYFDKKGRADWLAETWNLQREINPVTKSKSTRGLPPTKKNQEFWTALIIQYLEEEIDVQFDDAGEKKVTLGLTRILDPLLLEELITYNPGDDHGNYDRVVAFGHALVYMNYLDKYFPIADVRMKSDKKTIEVVQTRVPFGFGQRSGGGFKPRKNPFNL